MELLRVVGKGHLKADWKDTVMAVLLELCLVEQMVWLMVDEKVDCLERRKVASKVVVWECQTAVGMDDSMAESRDNNSVA